MNKAQIYNLSAGLSSVSVFRNILKSDVLSAFCDLLCCEGSERERMKLYGDFVYSLKDYGNSFSGFLKKAVSEDENLYIVSKAKGREIPESVEKNLSEELKLFSLLSELTPEGLFEDSGYEGYVPVFENEKTDFTAFYKERAEKVDSLGYGIFASKAMFKIEDDEIVPVDSADDISLSSL